MSHCWHETGSGATRYDREVYWATVRCCWCGEARTREYRMRAHQSNGDGPREVIWNWEPRPVDDEPVTCVKACRDAITRGGAP